MTISIEPGYYYWGSRFNSCFLWHSSSKSDSFERLNLPSESALIQNQLLYRIRFYMYGSWENWNLELLLGKVQFVKCLIGALLSVARWMRTAVQSVSDRVHLHSEEVPGGVFNREDWLRIKGGQGVGQQGEREVHKHTDSRKLFSTWRSPRISNCPPSYVWSNATNILDCQFVKGQKLLLSKSTFYNL